MTVAVPPPALRHVGAVRLLADGVEPEPAQGVLDLLVALPARYADPEPGRLLGVDGDASLAHMGGEVAARAHGLLPLGGHDR